MRRNCGEVWGKRNIRMMNHAIRDVAGDSMGLGVWGDKSSDYLRVLSEKKT
jgi:hypothetical protein